MLFGGTTRHGLTLGVSISHIRKGPNNAKSAAVIPSTASPRSGLRRSPSTLRDLIIALFEVHRFGDELWASTESLRVVIGQVEPRSPKGPATSPAGAPCQRPHPRSRRSRVLELVYPPTAGSVIAGQLALPAHRNLSAEHREADPAHDLGAMAGNSAVRKPPIPCRQPAAEADSVPASPSSPSSSADLAAVAR